ncbi:MAG: DUF393 domain-containing protein [Bacteroidales bacterium]|nr:DUF393 domain-containing protein [Bacteroidales bacterium]
MPVVLFDGACPFCNRSVRFIHRHDQSGVFYFVPLDSQAGRDILAKLPSGISRNDTMILYDGGQVWIRSRAVLRILRYLGGRFILLYRLLRWIPPPLLDWIYDFIARNRFRLTRMAETCPIPDPSMGSHIITSSAALSGRSD